jgi:hypothetical protein
MESNRKIPNGISIRFISNYNSIPEKKEKKWKKHLTKGKKQCILKSNKRLIGTNDWLNRETKRRRDDQDQQRYQSSEFDAAAWGYAHYPWEQQALVERNRKGGEKNDKIFKVFKWIRGNTAHGIIADISWGIKEEVGCTQMIKKGIEGKWKAFLWNKFWFRG